MMCTACLFICPSDRLSLLSPVVSSVDAFVGIEQAQHALPSSNSSGSHTPTSTSNLTAATGGATLSASIANSGLGSTNPAVNSRTR